MLSLCPLSVLPCTPLEQIDAAHAAGFDAVGLRLVPTLNTDIDVMADKPLRLAIERRLQATNLEVLDIEIVRIGPETNLPAIVPMLEYGREIGARYVTVTGRLRGDCQPEDEALTVSKLHQLCELADRHGIRPQIEFMAFRGIGSLDEAAHIVDLVSHFNLAICIDVLHHFRSGGTVSSVLNLDASTISCVQLCDASSIAPPMAELPREARYGRLELGEGDLPLRDLLMAVPGDVPVAIEVPSAARSRLSINERAEELIQSARVLLSTMRKATPIGTAPAP
jgi:sugar phosphate isomerase/epimerase